MGEKLEVGDMIIGWYSNWLCRSCCRYEVIKVNKKSYTVASPKDDKHRANIKFIDIRDEIDGWVGDWRYTRYTDEKWGKCINHIRKIKLDRLMNSIEAELEDFNEEICIEALEKVLENIKGDA